MILMPTPMPATIIIISASISKSPFMTRSTAKYTKTPVRTHIIDIFTKAPNISEKTRRQLIVHL